MEAHRKYAWSETANISLDRIQLSRPDKSSNFGFGIASGKLLLQTHCLPTPHCSLTHTSDNSGRHFAFNVQGANHSLREWDEIKEMDNTPVENVSHYTVVKMLQGRLNPRLAIFRTTGAAQPPKVISKQTESIGIASRRESLSSIPAFASQPDMVSSVSTYPPQLTHVASTDNRPARANISEPRSQPNHPTGRTGSKRVLPALPPSRGNAIPGANQSPAHSQALASPVRASASAPARVPVESRAISSGQPVGSCAFSPSEESITGAVSLAAPFSRAASDQSVTDTGPDHIVIVPRSARRVSRTRQVVSVFTSPSSAAAARSSPDLAVVTDRVSVVLDDAISGSPVSASPVRVYVCV
jgi:hypothetical protein